MVERMSELQLLTILARVFRDKAGFHEAFGHEERAIGLREAARHCEDVALHYGSEAVDTLYVDTSRGFWCGHASCNYWSLSREDFDSHWKDKHSQCGEYGPNDLECGLPKGHVLPHRDAEVPISWPIMKDRKPVGLSPNTSRILDAAEASLNKAASRNHVTFAGEVEEPDDE